MRDRAIRPGAHEASRGREHARQLAASLEEVLAAGRAPEPLREPVDGGAGERVDDGEDLRQIVRIVNDRAERFRRRGKIVAAPS